MLQEPFAKESPEGSKSFPRTPDLQSDVSVLNGRARARSARASAQPTLAESYSVAATYASSSLALVAAFPRVAMLAESFTEDVSSCFSCVACGPSLRLQCLKLLISPASRSVIARFYVGAFSASRAAQDGPRAIPSYFWRSALSVTSPLSLPPQSKYYPRGSFMIVRMKFLCTFLLLSRCLKRLPKLLS